MRFVRPTQTTHLIPPPLTLAIALIGLGLNSLAAAQETILEEVIITSQKRPQSLQDVPISVAAIDGETIEKMGVENLEDLSSFVPNLHFTETGIGTQMRVRGIGSDNSQGFEQSVGMYVDGIQHGRAQLFRAPIFDMERIEVMRGPQGTLFGKNSIAGALDLITAKPSDEFESKVSASHETEFGTNEYSGYISGPMSDKVKARLSVRAYDDPGYMINAFSDTREANQEEFALRAIVDWDFTDNLSAMLKAEHSTFDIVGRSSETTQDIPASAATPTYAQVLSSLGSTIDTNLDYVRSVDANEYSNNTIDTFTLQLDYQWNDYTITALTGQVGFDYEEKCDCDYTSANIFNLDLFEDYEQISQEIRISSPENQTVEWVAGVFYQSYDQDFSDTFNLERNSMLPPILIGGLIRKTNADNTLSDAEKAATIAQNQAALMMLAGAGVAREFKQASDAWAVFGDVTWNVSHEFQVTLGARFTEEKKDATKKINGVDIYNSNTPLAGLVGATTATIFHRQFALDTEQLQLLSAEQRAAMNAPSGHNLDLSRDESAFTPSLTLTYYLNEDVMTYAKVNKGFKAGGFDPRSNNPYHFEFEEETVIAYELGSKLGLAEGRGELNVALFNMNYDNLQISQFDGKLGFNIGNAKDTVVQGMELNGRWQLNEHFSSHFGLAYLDFEYKDFKNGNCYQGQQPDEYDVETEAPLCDFSGKRGVYTPELTLNGSLEYRRALHNDMSFVHTTDVQWVDEQIVHVNQDPAGDQDAYTMVSMRIGVETDTWQLALLGQNLLDEEVRSYSGNTPLSDSIAGSNTHYSFVRRPRTLTLTGTYMF